LGYYELGNALLDAKTRLGASKTALCLWVSQEGLSLLTAA